VKARDPHVKTEPLYPKVKFDPQEGKSVKTKDWQDADWWGLAISSFFLLVLFYLWWTTDCLIPNAVLIVTTVLLLLYRWMKEVRTTWRELGKPTA
jgi:chromate transport protein ChrA